MSDTTRVHAPPTKMPNRNEKTPEESGFVFYAQGLLGRLLVRDQLKAIIMALLVIGEHHGDAIGKRLVLQSDGKSSAALARPGSANAGPDFLAFPVFAGLLAVVDDIGRGVRHMLSV